MKYMRQTAGCTWRNYTTNRELAKELNITPVLDKMQHYRRNWMQHINRMPRNRLPRIMKKRQTKRQREQGKTKRLLGV
jgi:hypothetical protein